MLRPLEIYDDVQCVSSLHFTPGAEAAETNPRSWWVKAEPGPQMAVLIQGYDSSHPSMLCEHTQHSCLVLLWKNTSDQKAQHNCGLW